MANTEGLPDEYIDSLMAASAGGVNSNLSLRKNHRLHKNHRMDLPMGDAPAAKVVRSSSSRKQVQFTNKNDDNRGDASVQEKTTSRSRPQEELLTMPLVGDVIEHGNHDLRTCRTKRSTVEAGGKEKTSRFAQRNQPGITTGQANGFPSVHVPIGTFVNKKPIQESSRKNIDKDTMTVKYNNSTATLQRSAAKTIQCIEMNTTTGTSSNDDLIKASQQDAIAMISNMTPNEIKQYQQEVHESLSPEMIAFLKRRGSSSSSSSSKKKNKKRIDKKQSDYVKGVTGTTGIKDDDVEKSQMCTRSVTFDFNQKASTMQPITNDTRSNWKEKERIANLMSSVRTHEDLDAVFQMEMQQIHPLDNTEAYNNDDMAILQKDSEENFTLACDLLRSTSPRQTLWAARTVCLQLEKLVHGTQFPMMEARNTLSPILSVSLRCLLDKPVSSTFLLHTFALQSLYYLTIIHAHPEHVVYVSLDPRQGQTPSLIFQKYFLDDSVPTPALDVTYPPMTVQPLSINDDTNNKTETLAAYAASSSTISAISDGKAFQKDPMWTLLSKMKILPRLAFLLETYHDLLTVEACVATCGILCMVGQRSPGAASAIVQHKTLIPQLMRQYLAYIQNGHDSHSVRNGMMVPYAIISLFCTLARQSRVAAEGLPLEDILPPILASTAETNEVFSTQQLALVLWRTMLRYGLGLEALHSMLTLSARHLALPYSNEFSLSTEFVSCYTQVLECVKIYKGKINGGLQGEGSINQASANILSSAEKDLASTIRSVIPQSSTPSDHFLNDGEDSAILRYLWNAARLQLLSSWVQLSGYSDNSNSATTENEYFSSEDCESIISAVQTWVQPNSDVERAWSIISPQCGISLHTEIEKSDVQELKPELEAAAGSFLCGFMSILIALARLLDHTSVPMQEKMQKLCRETYNRIIDRLQPTLSCSTSGNYVCKRPNSPVLPRDGWINQSCFAVAKFLLHSMSKGLVATSSHLTFVRSLVFALLGRLQIGDESMAAVLFSSDSLYQTSGNPLGENTLSTGSSPISSWFLSELCGSDFARKQLDHSFKLHHGFGLTSAGYGSFALQSLLSVSDQPSLPQSSNKEDHKGSHLLPLGSFWLWTSLTGIVQLKEGMAGTETREAVDVIAASLQLMLEQEEAEEVMDICGYSTTLSVGSKLYYLMNLCLQTEQVLNDQRILDCADAVVDRYLKQFGDNEYNIRDFCRECLVHVETANMNEKGDFDQIVANDSNSRDKKLFDTIVNYSNASPVSSPYISSKELRSLDALVEDMVMSYREYGAQYEFCTKCIRTFLLPTFPTSIRIRALQELDGMLHLLTLDKESLEPEEMSQMLERSLPGGLLSIDQSSRDDPEMLNKITSILSREHTSARPVDGYIRAYSIALLAQSLAISLSLCSGVEVAKARLVKLDAGMVQTICNVTSEFCQHGGTKDDLVNAVMEALSTFEENEAKNGQAVDLHFVESCLDQCSISMKK